MCIKNKCLYLHKRMYSVAIFSFNNKAFLQVFNTCKKKKGSTDGNSHCLHLHVQQSLSLLVYKKRHFTP